MRFQKGNTIGFRKGQSGNPGGRSRSEAQIRAMIQERGAEIVEVLFGILFDEKAEQNVRVRAAGELMDRGYGKPTESIKIAGGVTVEHRKRVILETRGQSEN